jgi:hypothetical protein
VLAGSQPEHIAGAVDRDAEREQSGRLATLPSRILTLIASMNAIG